MLTLGFWRDAKGAEFAVQVQIIDDPGAPPVCLTQIDQTHMMLICNHPRYHIQEDGQVMALNLVGTMRRSGFTPVDGAPVPAPVLYLPS